MKGCLVIVGGMTNKQGELGMGAAQSQGAQEEATAKAQTFPEAEG